MDEERHPEPLVVDHVVVLLDAVLAEALAVVAHDDEDRIVVEAELFVLSEEVPQEEILVSNGVQVAVEHLVLGELLHAVAVGDDIVVVGRQVRQVARNGPAAAFFSSHFSLGSSMMSSS